jgi:hypothetical protein
MLPFVNYWEDYGGRERYVEWSREKGGWARRPDDFYKDPTCKMMYKNAARIVMNRVNTYNGRCVRPQLMILCSRFRQFNSPPKGQRSNVRKDTHDTRNCTESNSSRHPLCIVHCAKCEWKLQPTVPAHPPR